MLNAFLGFAKYLLRQIYIHKIMLLAYCSRVFSAIASYDVFLLEMREQ